MGIIESVSGYLLGIFALLWIYQLWDRRNRRLPPGPFRLPLLGNILQIQQADGKYPYRAVAKLSKKYGDIMFLQIGVVSAVVISGYDTIKRALNGEDFLNRFDTEWFLHRSFGKRIGRFGLRPYNLFILGLVSSHTETWRPTRRFTTRHLRDFGFGKTNFQQKFINTEIEELFRTLDEAIEQNNGIIQPHTLFGIPGVNIVWASTANTRFDHKDPKIVQLINLMKDYTKNVKIMEGAAVAYPFLLKWFPSNFSAKKLSEIDDKIHAFLKSHINEIRDRGTYKTGPKSFIETFLQQMETDKIKSEEDGEVFSEEVLISILYDLFVTGSDTVSSTMTFALMWLAMYPEVQERLRAELKNVIENERLPTLSDRLSLPYARATILELHRRIHLVPTVPRKVYKDTALDQFIIPAESLIIFNLYDALMDEGFWGDPQNFRPSRFLDNENNIIHAERVINFAVGKRNCIGEAIAEATIFAFVTQLVQKYDFLPAKDGQVFIAQQINGSVLSAEKYEIKVRKRQ